MRIWWQLFFCLIVFGCNNPFVPPKAPKPDPPQLIVPKNGDTLRPISKNVIFSWVPVEKKLLKKYHLQVSDLASFEQCIIDTLTEVVGYLYTLLDTTAKYWWRMKVQTKRYNKWSDWSEAWWFVVRKAPNRAPETPNSPSPPDGATDVSIDLSLYWNSGDKDGDTVIYTIYLGEDSLFTEPLDTVVDESGGIITTVGYELGDTLGLHTRYYWKVEARDNCGAISSGPVWYFETCSIPPSPPNKPEEPSASFPWYIDEAITFTTTATDPEGRNVAYKFDFGDGYQSEWTGWVGSGEPGSVPHIYKELGVFYVKAKAQNTAYRESEWSDSTEIMVKVGPGACWVADYHGNKVVKLGRGGSWICQFDDQHEWPWGSPGMKGPTSLRVNPIDSYCWVACTYEGVIFQLAPSCSGVVRLQGSDTLTGHNPSTPCVDENGDCWMTLAWDKKFVKFEQYTGNILHTIYDEIPGGIYPVAIDIDGPYIWAVETSWVANGYLAKFGIDGSLIFRLSFFNGVWVDVDPVTHWCWVADEMNDRVAKVSSDGNTVNHIWGFEKPPCVSVNPNTHECWVADRENDRVVKLSETGDKVLVKYGFENPTGVEVDAQDGSCWVSDAGNHRVVKLSSGGDILFTVSGFTTPMGLSVNPNPEP